MRNNTHSRYTRYAGRQISILHRYGQIYLDEHLSGLGLTTGQVPVLAELYFSDNCSQEELAERLWIDKATSARALCALEQRGLVCRHPSPADRRRNVVELTSAAHQIKAEFFRIVDTWTEALTAGFSEAERERALKVLRRMAVNAGKALETLRENA
jgi:DNA-binding MarR family transcriptional regulator